MTMTNSAITIIIPSLNSPIINQVITAVQTQQGIESSPEIIVVGRDDEGLIPHAGNLTFIETDQPLLPPQARNLGLKTSGASLLIFLDSDCLPTPDWLAQHIAAHKAGHRVVSGSILPVGQNYWHLTYNLTLFHEILAPNAAGPRDFVATLNLSVARGVIDRIGLMDEAIDRGEDVDWTVRMHRAGITPYFWPKAMVRHAHNRTTLSQVWRDCARSGFHMRQLRLKHADIIRGPGLLRYPRLVLAFSPLIAAWATGRILWRHPAIVRRFWRTIPGLYLTKIAWCWGASRPAASEPERDNGS